LKVLRAYGANGTLDPVGHGLARDFMAIVALQAPDFRTISEFRRRHLAALSALFVQVLKLCERAGLVKLGHVALDGTKSPEGALCKVFSGRPSRLISRKGAIITG
jgi:hypothetical protein